MVKILCVLLLSSSAFAQVPKTSWTLESSILTYNVHFVLKSFKGISRGAKGKGECKSGTCEFIIGVPLKDFDTGDTNRDFHMLEVMKAAQNPMVLVKVTFSEKIKLAAFQADVEIDVAGSKKTYSKLPLTADVKKDGMVAVKGKIPLVLSDIKVEEPWLLTVKIDEAVPVDFEMIWK